MDEQERKLVAEERRRKEVLKQAQIENIKMQQDSIQKKLLDRKMEKQTEGQKAIDAKEAHKKS